MKTYKFLNEEYQYKYFFDVDTQTEGLEIYQNDKRLGATLLEEPDYEDEDAVKHFYTELEGWIVYNNF